MNADTFTAQIKNAIIEENTGIYRDLFENTESASDPYWIRALALYHSLDASQRSVFMEVVRQTAINTVSNVFGQEEKVSGTVSAKIAFRFLTPFLVQVFITSLHARGVAMYHMVPSI